MYFLNKLKIYEDQIYGTVLSHGSQQLEASIRTVNAKKKYRNYLEEICKYHSVAVMDKEVNLFIDLLPKNSLVLDVGGCWGWHWRNLYLRRPDIKLVILDFIRENLLHAKNLLSDQINKNIFLVHGDANNLEFESECFDAVWSVQVIQHIKEYEKVYDEVYRVLKDNGKFSDYSLNNSIIRRIGHFLSGREYIINGNYSKGWFLRRANKIQLNYLEKKFNDLCKIRYSEIIFLPEIKFKSSGKESSLISKFDSYLTSEFFFYKYLARQQSFHIKKNVHK